MFLGRELLFNFGWSMSAGFFSVFRDTFFIDYYYLCQIVPINIL